MDGRTDRQTDGWNNIDSKINWLVYPTANSVAEARPGGRPCSAGFNSLRPGFYPRVLLPFSPEVKQCHCRPVMWEERKKGGDECPASTYHMLREQGTGASLRQGHRMQWLIESLRTEGCRYVTLFPMCLASVSIMIQSVRQINVPLLQFSQSLSKQDILNYRNTW